MVRHRAHRAHRFLRQTTFPQVCTALLFKQQGAFSTSSRNPIRINPSNVMASQPITACVENANVVLYILAQLCLASAETHKSSSTWVPGKALYNSFYFILFFLPPLSPVLSLLKVGRTCIQSEPAGRFMALATAAVQSPRGNHAVLMPEHLRLLSGFRSGALSFRSPQTASTNKQACFGVFAESRRFRQWILKPRKWCRAATLTTGAAKSTEQFCCRQTQGVGGGGISGALWLTRCRYYVERMLQLLRKEDSRRNVGKVVQLEFVS